MASLAAIKGCLALPARMYVIRASGNKRGTEKENYLHTPPERIPRSSICYALRKFGGLIHLRVYGCIRSGQVLERFVVRAGSISASAVLRAIPWVVGYISSLGS